MQVVAVVEVINEDLVLTGQEGLVVEEMAEHQVLATPQQVHQIPAVVAVVKVMEVLKQAVSTVVLV
jgi:RNase P/RNase MRP subunit p29